MGELKPCVTDELRAMAAALQNWRALSGYATVISSAITEIEYLSCELDQMESDKDGLASEVKRLMAENDRLRAEVAHMKACSRARPEAITEAIAAERERAARIVEDESRMTVLGKWWGEGAILAAKIREGSDD